MLRQPSEGELEYRQRRFKEKHGRYMTIQEIAFADKVWHASKELRDAFRKEIRKNKGVSEEDFEAYCEKQQQIVKELKESV